MNVSRDVARIFGLGGLISAEVWANIFQSEKTNLAKNILD